MLKEKLMKYIECDGCKKTVTDDQLNIVSFTTRHGVRRYDLCEMCTAQWEDILKRPAKEVKKGFAVSLSDFSIENREKYIAGNQAPSTEKVDSIGEDRFSRCQKTLQKMAAHGYSASKIAKLSGLSPTNVSRMMRGDVCAPRSSTLDILEKMFEKEGYYKK